MLLQKVLKTEYSTCDGKLDCLKTLHLFIVISRLEVGGGSWVSAHPLMAQNFLNLMHFFGILENPPLEGWLPLIRGILGPLPSLQISNRLQIQDVPSDGVLSPTYNSANCFMQFLKNFDRIQVGKFCNRIQVGKFYNNTITHNSQVIGWHLLRHTKRYDIVTFCYAASRDH